MAKPSSGMIRHRSFAYLLLLAAAVLVGLGLSVLARMVLQPAADQLGAGFWADFARGGIVTLALLPVPLALIVGRRRIRRSWKIRYEDGRSMPGAAEHR